MQPLIISLCEVELFYRKTLDNFITLAAGFNILSFLVRYFYEALIFKSCVWCKFLQFSFIDDLFNNAITALITKRQKRESLPLIKTIYKWILP